jgi:hypothetical protein
VVYIVAMVVALAGVAGAGIGFKTGFHNGERPGLGGGDQAQATDTATLAKPIVDLQAIEQQAPVPAANAVQEAKADDDSNSIAVRTAQAEQVQSKSATSTTSIDDVLASSTEKPQAPAKPSTDEQAPQATSGNGGKSDVPF